MVKGTILLRPKKPAASAGRPCQKFGKAQKGRRRQPGDGSRAHKKAYKRPSGRVGQIAQKRGGGEARKHIGNGILGARMAETATPGGSNELCRNAKGPPRDGERGPLARSFGPRDREKEASVIVRKTEFVGCQSFANVSEIRVFAASCDFSGCAPSTEVIFEEERGQKGKPKRASKNRPLRDPQNPP